MDAAEVYKLVDERDRLRERAMQERHDKLEQNVTNRLDRHEDNVAVQFQATNGLIEDLKSQVSSLSNEVAALVGTDRTEGTLTEALRLMREANAQVSALATQHKVWHDDEDVPFREDTKKRLNDLDDKIGIIKWFIMLVKFIRDGSKSAGENAGKGKAVYHWLTAAGITWIGLIQFLRSTSSSATTYIHLHRSWVYGIGVPAVLVLTLFLPRLANREKE